MPKTRFGEAAACLAAVAALISSACSPTPPTTTTGPGSTAQPESTATRSSTIPTATASSTGTLAVTPTATVQKPLTGAATPTVTVIFGGPINGIVLTITEPQDEAVVEDKVITIRGKASADAIVSINGDVVTVDASGNFSQSVTLDEGPNHFAVTATDSDGDMTTTEFTISYAP